MKITKEKVDKIVNLLQDLLDVKVTCEYVRREFKSKKFKQYFSELLYNLDHYFSDDDIRERNVDYREMQNHELEKLIYCLKNQMFDKVEKITFLSESDI